MQALCFKRYKTAAAVLAVAAALALLAGWRYTSARPSVDTLRQQLATAPDEQLADCLGQAAAWGEPGLKLVVQGLGASRHSVATAARGALFEELARCELLPSEQAGRRVANLAALLAEETPRFDEAGRRAAATIAARIIAWPRQAVADQRGQLVADCRAVLRTASLDDRLASLSAPSRLEQVVQTATVGQTSHLAPLPGGGLPIDLHVAPSPPRLLSVDVSEAKPLGAATDE